MRKFLKNVWVPTLILLALPLVSSAQWFGFGDYCALLSGLTFMLCKVSYLLNALLPVLTALGVVYFVWGVVQYMIGGDEEAKTKGRRKQVGDLSSSDRALFERLRVIRKRFAEEQKVPPFVIFSDKTLHEMCRHFPKTESEMRQITGVGDVKLERYGRKFIEEIRAYVESNPERSK